MNGTLLLLICSFLMICTKNRKLFRNSSRKKASWNRNYFCLFIKYFIFVYWIHLLYFIIKKWRSFTHITRVRSWLPLLRKNFKEFKKSSPFLRSTATSNLTTHKSKTALILIDIGSIQLSINQSVILLNVHRRRKQKRRNKIRNFNQQRR